MPAFLGAALVFGITVHSATKLIAERLRSSAADTPSKAARTERVGLHLFALLQLSLLLHAPWRQIPSSSDRRAADAFIASLGRLDGDVYVMDHGYYPALVGKRTFAQGMAVLDVLRADRGPIGQALASELTSAVRGRRFGAIVVGTTVPSRADVDDPAWNDGIQLPWMPDGFVAGLQSAYTPAAHLFRDSRDFAPKVGWRRRPAVVYVPRARRDP
jgi:hypothetical protein